MDQFTALSSSQYSALSTSASAALDPSVFASPIVLDLNGDGVRTRSIAEGVKFDLFDNGTAISSGWVSGGDGLLVMDRNHDGVITNGSELFGTSTRLSDGTKAADGYAALREFDSNKDGFISETDAVFKDLRVWIDGDGDGVSEVGEIRSLDSLGITQINVNAVNGTEVDNGNVLGLTSTYQTSDGVVHAAADVWFRVEGVASNPDTTLPATSEGNDLRSQVSSLAQAMAAFDGSADFGAGPSIPVLNPLVEPTAPASLTIAQSSGSLADAMSQFTTQGQPLNKGEVAAASPYTKLNISSASVPSSDGILSVSGNS